MVEKGMPEQPESKMPIVSKLASEFRTAFILVLFDVIDSSQDNDAAHLIQYRRIELIQTH